MKKFLAILVAGTFVAVAFANEASAPMGNMDMSNMKNDAKASAPKKAAKKCHKGDKKCHKSHSKKHASEAQ